MQFESIIVWIVIGGVAGWLASLLVGGSSGIIGNIVVGILGSLIAGALLPRLGISVGGGIGAAIIHSTIGAVILLVILRLIRP